MIRKQNTRRACWLALLVLLAPVAGAVPLASAVPASAPGTQQYAVVQGGECHTVGAVGDGSMSVTDHYDYRSPYNSEPGGFAYSSQGAIQANQASNLYVYDGTDGTSLVMVHDAYGDAPGGSTVTFELSRLPSDGQWVVQDDNYPLKDDEWNIQDSQATISWFWGAGRTDGGVFLGLNDMGDDGVTIDPGFNQEADHWSEWNSKSPTNQELTAWTFQSGEGGSDVPLDMSTELTIHQGSCDQNALTGNTNAALDAPGETAADTSVSFDASGTTGPATEYEWDFGDGTTTTTEDASTTHTYSDPGVYTASVTAAGSNTSDAAFATVAVTAANNDAPAVTVSGPGHQSAADGNTYVDPRSVVTFSAAGTTDDVGVDAYEWDFGDGTTTTTETAAVPHTFAEAGNYTVSVTATDVQDASATASMDVVVVDTVAPTAAISGPTAPNVTAGEAVSFAGSQSTDANTVVAYNWTLGDGTNLTGESITHTYAKAGTYNVTLTAVDQAGNEGTQTRTIDVAQGDTPPVATLSNPGDVEANANVTLDASASSDEGTITAYRWDVDGDGTVDQTTTGPTLTADLSSPGERTVVVTVVDDDDNTASADVTFDVTPEAPPTPAIDAPDTVEADQQLSVDGSESTDNGDIASYKWSFGDGATTTGSSASHTYSDTGTYNVTLTVTDTLGNDATATHPVTVEQPTDDADPAPDPSPSPPPSPSPSPPPASANIGFADFSVAATELVAGENATVTASLRNTGDAAGVETVTFTAGDRTEQRRVRLGAGQRSDVTFTHAFDDPGNHTLSVDSKSRTVTVTPAVSEFDVSDAVVRSQDLGVGDAAIVQTRVTNTGTVAGNHSLNLTMSDGSVVTKAVSLAAGETKTVSFTPTVEASGDHTVSLGNETLSFSVRDPNTAGEPGTQTTANPDSNDPSTPNGADAASGSAPGFGPVTALVAALAAALVAIRAQ